MTRHLRLTLDFDLQVAENDRHLGIVRLAETCSVLSNVKAVYLLRASDGMR